MAGRGGRAPIVGINVTPFVDIALVLLIIMMVSSTYIVSQTLKVDLPKTASSDQGVPRTFVVTIFEDGAILFNDKPSSLEAITKELSAIDDKKNVSLVVTADRAAQHGRVVEVIDAAKSADITKFAINVDRRK
jgi:biopolymer transport protein ExbD